MWTALIESYREATRFARTHPLLFLVPVVFEMAQHMVEWKLGMFEGIAEARAIADSPWRMGFGTAKVMALLLCVYWMPRFLARRGTLGEARTMPAANVPGSYWPLMVYQLVATIGVLWGGPALARSEIVSQGTFSSVTFIVQMLLGLLWAGWFATAPVGRDVLGLMASSRLMVRHLPWAFAFMIVATSPPMVAHYALGYLAIGAPIEAMWALILIDVVVVGYLALLIAGVPTFQIRHALARRGVADLAVSPA